MKIGKYSILLTIKESYLFSRNLFGLIFHPFKTLKEIILEKDRSQELLIFGLPFYFFTFGFVFITGLRILIKAPKEWGFLARSLLIFFLLIALGLFVYLGYWLIKILVPPKRRD